ncbi:SusC/RagA family TonB-linked outer membrane protein [Aquimarina agarivorans]|uniref:SusC/RagA family TonB-linked outer membrane protein n=1 Tax=Aquimarina agarivorans TaxID=980584 RepID=UPI000248FAB6|nr:SusC/RagA family TonB-linked outer membrane protein [Aquimarina agarivorans]
MIKKTNKQLVLIFIMVFQSIMAQNKTVTGTVTDNLGMPLPGVTISKKTDFSGTVTNFDGNYSIDVTSNDELVFSYIGFITQTILVGNQTEINTSLQVDTESLQEVVVTALGISKEKKVLGYSTQEVKGDLITETRPSNAINALSGKVSGLQISTPTGNLGGSTRILLRGAGSILGENRPLIVIDGVPVNNDNNNDRRNLTTTQTGGGGRDYGDNSFDINPDDIESMNVLKGSAAAALYGSRGANGVILITTKSAKDGAESITINSGVTFESVNVLPKVQKLYGGGAGDPSTIGQSSFNTATINGRQFEIVDYATDESWGPRYDPNRLVLHWDAFDPEFADDFLNPRPWVYPENDAESFYNTGVTTNTNVAFAKAYADAGVRFSLGRTKSTGIIPNSELTKTTFNLNGSSKIANKVTASAGVNYTITEGFNRPETGYGDNSLLQKFYQFGQTSLDYGRLSNYLLSNGVQRPWNRTAFNDATPRFSDNPYWTILQNTAADRRNRVYGNVKVKYQINDKLFAIGSIYNDFYNLKITERVAVGSQATSSFVEVNRSARETNYEARVHYDDSFFNENFSVSAFAGVNRRNNFSAEVDANTTGGLATPGLYSLNNSIGDLRVTELNTEARVNSIFGAATFGFKDMVFLEVTGRNDYSSTLPIANNSYFFPSASLSFAFSEVVNTNWLSFGKIRVAFANVGNDTAPYRLVNTYASRPTFFSGIRYTQRDADRNDALVPEEKESFEVGLEASLFNNRVSFEATYYNENTFDLITPLELDPGTGFTSTFINAGKLSNKGIEALVNVVPIKNENFKWGLTWNFSKNENKLEELLPGIETLELARFPFNGVTLNAVVGEKYGQIRGTNYIFDDEGNRVVDANGRYMESRNVENLGSVLPDYNMGIRNEFNYKNLSFSFLIDIQKGGHYRSLTNIWGNYSGILEETAANNIREEGIILEGVTGTVVFDDAGNYTVTDTETNDQVISAQQYGQDHFLRADAQNVFKADYMKLREVSLGYSLPKDMIGSLDGVTFSLFGRNLLVWGLDNDNFDPEVASTGSGNIQGSEGGSLPSTRSYGFNVQLKF